MMTKQNLVTAIATISIFSIIAISLWQYEILGFSNLDWISGQLYSPYAVALIVVFAFMAPFIISNQAAIKKLILPTIILYAVNVLCFEGGKWLCYNLYGWSGFEARPISDFIFIGLKGVFLHVVIGLSYWMTACKIIKRNKKMNMVFITMLILLVLPLSSLTDAIHSGFGSPYWAGTAAMEMEHRFLYWTALIFGPSIDAVHSGYPVFWTTVLLGLSGIIIARQKHPYRQ